MKILNLVIAIMYSFFLGVFLLQGMGVGDAELVIGVILLSGPVAVNWITFFHLKNKEGGKEKLEKALMKEIEGLIEKNKKND